MRYQMRISRLRISHHHQLDYHHQLNKGIAPEDSKDLGHVSDHIHVHHRMLVIQEFSRIRQLRAKMKIQQPWVHRIMRAIIQGHHKIKKTHGDRVHKNQKERKILQKSSRAHHQRLRSISQKDSDEDYEEPQNESGTSSNSQATVPVLPLHQGKGASSQGQEARSHGPAASADSGDEDSESCDEYSAQSQDSGRTVLYPDLDVLTNDEHWAMTLETHKYAAAVGSFCFVTTENGKQQDIYNLTTMPCVERSLYLNEMTDDFGNIQVEVPTGVDGRTRDVLEQCTTACGKEKRRSRAREEASAQEVRGHYKQFAEAKLLEYRSWFDNEVFDLVVLRKVELRNYVTGRWVLTIKTNKQSNFLKAKARWVLRGFQDKQKEYQQKDSPPSTRPGFRMSCQMAASKSWNIFLTLISRQSSCKYNLMV